MDSAFHRASGSSDARVLCLMLPGLQMKPTDFQAGGLIADAQSGDAPVDVMVPALKADDYLDQGFSATLHTEILESARRRYRRIVVLGISLGGLGAVLHAQHHCQDFDRLVLLAPFLGNPGTLAEVQRGGGLGRWAPGALAPGDIERPALLWLRSHIAMGQTPSVQLGYGRGDRFVQASKLLAELLPGGSVVTVDGGHDWPTWRALWRLILARFPLDRQD
jgi:hypothetical protein